MSQRRAYLYARCSTEEQKGGRSIDRQLGAGEAYCKRHGIPVADRRFIDDGLSAFHAANTTVGQLGKFLTLVKEGRIPKGAVLVTEHLDRISRDVHREKAAQAIYPLVRAGVELATVNPEAVYNKGNIDQMATWLPMEIHLAQAAEESRKKSERLKDVHQDKRSTARADGTPHGRRHHRWLRLVGQVKNDRGRVVEPGRYEVDEEKAALVRRMFRLAAEGYGTGRIARVLNAEYPKGMTGRGWSPGYIRYVLRDRAVLGEYQPYTGTAAKKGKKSSREKAGDPIPGYYGKGIVSEADFYRVQEALGGRRRGGGRMTGVPNLFNGLVYDAFDQQRMVVNGVNGRRTLVSGGAVKRLAGSVFRSIDYLIFERAILGRLKELKPSDVTGRPNGAQDREAAASGRLAAINRRLEALNAKATAAALDPEQDASIYDHQLEQLGRERKLAVKELEAAQAEAASRPADNLGEVQSLIQLLDEATPEERPALRQKVQAGLRRVVQSIWVAVVVRGRGRPARGRSRVARVLVLFKSDGGKVRCRNYVIGQQWPLPSRPGGWWVDDWPEVVDPRRAEEAVKAHAEELWDVGSFYHGEGGPWSGPDDDAWWAEVFDRPLNPMPERD
jgi:DNA invertase Pin-like site-specific DNA recombinase